MHRLTRRGVRVTAAIAALAAVTVGPFAPPASAVAAEPVAAKPVTAKPVVRHGLKPIHPRPHLQSTGTLSVQSSGSQGVVSPHPAVYLVFWGSQWSSDPAGVAADLQKMFHGLFGTKDTWTSIMDQYCEGVPSGTKTCGTKGIHIQHPMSDPLQGVWFDNAKSEPSHATGSQIAAEAVKAATHFGNTSQTPNLNAQYVIVSAHGTHPDSYDDPNSGYCGYHDYTTSGAGNIAYTNLPYVPDLGQGACTTIGTRLLDGIESTETHEYAEVLTDFWPSRGWNGSLGENGDACIDVDRHITLTTGTFDVQGLWSNTANACVSKGPAQSDFSFALNPSTGTFPQTGGTTTSTITTSVTAGSAQSVHFSVASPPSGVTVSFNPATVTAGATSTMTVTATHGFGNDPLPMTVTATGTTATHQATYGLRSDFASLLSAGKPALASSEGGASYVAKNAFDGSTATRWASVSKVDPQWLRVDLGATHAVNRVTLTWDLSCATAYKIQFSTDGSTWTTPFSTTTGDGGVDDVALSGSGRYVRMLGSARCRTSYGYSLQEMQVFGS